MGVIDHPAGQGRKLWCGLDGAGEEERQEGEDARQAAHGLPAAGAVSGGVAPAAAAGGGGAVLKFTCGAAWALAVAENIVIGWALL